MKTEEFSIPEFPELTIDDDPDDDDPGNAKNKDFYEHWQVGPLEEISTRDTTN